MQTQEEGFNNEEQRITRRKKRERLEGIHLGGEIQKVIHHYFPDFIKQLRRVKDPRSQAYITYPSEMLLLMRILAAMGAIESMRQMTEEMNRTVCIQNIGKMLGIKNIEELPHWSSINNFLEKVSPEDLEKLNQALVRRLIRTRAFENNRYRKYWQVIIDGTGLYSFKKKHCDHCLTRVYHKDTEKEFTEYFHYVLEAKILFAPDLLVSVATEFIENPTSFNSEADKQDCELRAFYRLAEKLKAAFKRLPICLTFDSLYACQPVFSLCRDKNWRFIIRFKEKRIPSVASEFQALKLLSPENRVSRICCENAGISRKESYHFVSPIDYNGFLLNCAELSCQSADGTETSFVFLTNFPLNSKNVVSFIAAGRSRWEIENQGFNTQKNGDYFISHTFSYHWQAMKNHYLLIQTAHALVQLCLLRLIHLMIAFGTIRHFRHELLRHFCFFPIPTCVDSS